MSGSGDMVSRRGLLRTAGGVAVAGALAKLSVACARAESGAGASPDPPTPVKLPRLMAPTERESELMPAPLAPDKRVGYAIVGLGRLSLEEILPAFGHCKYSRPTALVSGDAQKAAQVAGQYGIDPKSVYSYETFDRLKDNKAVDIVYIVLPNSMHREYTIRAAQAGKHVLCEKPMANTSAECVEMIDACKKASRKLMVAYRLQYEPHHREMIRLCRAKEIGPIKTIMAVNAQHQGDPNQWRLKKALAGGGALPDIGIYCLNAARYLTGEEPIEVLGSAYSTPDDPRFREVDETVDFFLRFPSGARAVCSTSYSCHQSKRFRVMGPEGWAEMDPAFPYHGLRMRVSRKMKDSPIEDASERKLQEKNHFALEMDHLSQCVLRDRPAHTPGEEGLQDMRLIEAIYTSAREGRPVKLEPVQGLDVFRGPPPEPGA
ncbi:oxidoreductase [Sorangium cellulosum]|uniref:Oxidoreductase n=1 Tax=Sorangium cellulosum TaxID=56 RepID=A0A2L0F0Z6_SORCE|nr:Gfo/Idh/MocA family oxidoreductase [Sorangium cellulosum]AUX45149.1 oxidoreductase [Sorangium cellulosum]